MINRLIKQYDFEITEEGGLHSRSFELDKTITKLHGLLLQSNRDDLLYHRGSCKIEINRQEIFPEKYAAKNLMSGINVTVNDRYYNLCGLPPGNGTVKIEYRDNESIVVPFANHTVSLCLLCETTDTQ